MTVASTAREPGGGPGEAERQRTDVKKERRDWRQYVGFAPAAVLFGVFFIAPLCLIVVYSFWITKNYELVPTFTKNNYATIITTSTYVKTFGKTVLMAFLATIAALALAFPFCYWLVRYVPKRLQRVGLLLVVLPFWTSYLLRVYAWVAILGDHGAINSLLKALGLTHQPIRLFLYDNPGVFIVLVYLYFPFAALTLYASLERFDWRLLHAAVDLGATPMRAIANTLLPQMRLAMVTAGIFVFIPILGEYLAPAAIGGTNGVMMGNLIANFFSGFLLPLGSAASVLIALVILIVLIIFRRSLDTKDIYV
ncbi:MAG: spermidine/putrescine transport system permease protein [Mycobacterium sp.]|jgi:spermidine/putrescine transport system permease protein|uniref:ABC transporter permease n=1 Tax=Mycobacterium sp. TaxID=1785 RepID=UPI0028BC6F77|nr:Spermidine/putrescine transport system permease protein [Mycobacterium sp.]MDT5307506.1 spermidine/putrescine transport system permease protein [Mycobacterium sp.]